jgi:hypothetical protein
VAELSTAELGEVLGALDRIGDELAAIGTWLATRDYDQPSLLLQDSWHSVATAGWVLERPLRDARRAERRGAARPVQGG